MKSDAAFKQNLGESTRWVLKVARYLKAKGADAFVVPNLTRPTFEQRQGYIDGGDIKAMLRVEVKHRPDLQFTCREDFPFETVIVDEAYKIDRYPLITLWIYVIVAADGQHACIIPKTTRPQWLPQLMYDSKDDSHANFYVCPKELCQFVDMGADDGT